MKPTAIVIGAGFSGIAAAASLARRGFEVNVVEKNPAPGGRASVWRKDGFTFDMGPSFYWMPEVFERFFAEFGEKPGDHYELRRLDPSYKVVFGKGDDLSLPAKRTDQNRLFERYEPGAAAALNDFLAEAKIKYDLGMGELVYRPSLSWLEYARPDVLGGLMKTSVLRSLRKHVQDHFSEPRLRALMEFPVLFLGAAPQNTPALYSLMNYADLQLGTWYPMGGMGNVVEGMVRTAERQGARFHYGQVVTKIIVKNGRATGIETTRGRMTADVVVAGADYHHVEQEILPEEHRTYSQAYWAKRKMAPSSLLFYIGIDRQVPHLEHHTLFFDEALDTHSAAIYDAPAWPSKPLFYVSCSSKTDPSVAPDGKENMVVLIPIAPGLEDTEATREHYYDLVMERIANYIGIDLRPHVVLKRSYCINDLKEDYNAFRGNAYGLANTLRQTGPLRPSMKSRKVQGLYFTGQLTVPGPGVPPAIISGQVVAELVEKEFKQGSTARAKREQATTA
ncbi:MAG: phytoene desaturase [Flavobacteriales bacterium]|nr:phytoene desaturase [Flavobacteriales bacterium]